MQRIGLGGTRDRARPRRAFTVHRAYLERMPVRGPRRATGGDGAAGPGGAGRARARRRPRRLLLRAQHRAGGAAAGARLLRDPPPGGRRRRRADEPHGPGRRSGRRALDRRRRPRRGFLDPLPLSRGRTTSGRSRWTVELEACGTWWVAHTTGARSPGSGWRRKRRRSSAFEPHHRRLATDPESPFVQDAGGAAAARRPDRRRSGRGRCRRSGRRWTRKRVVADEDEFYAVLVGRRIRDRRRRLRELERSVAARPCEQHEAFRGAPREHRA